jgi:hydrogenase expression/formation protein HypC
MCLSIPAEILEINKNMAKVSVGGVVYNSSLDLIENVEVGDYILLHAGFAIEKIDKDEAEKTLNMIKETFENK